MQTIHADYEGQTGMKLSVSKTGIDIRQLQLLVRWLGDCPLPFEMDLHLWEVKGKFTTKAIITAKVLEKKP